MLVYNVYGVYMHCIYAVFDVAASSILTPQFAYITSHLSSGLLYIKNIHDFQFAWKCLMSTNEEKDLRRKIER